MTKKIVFINQTFGLGGAEQFGADLLTYFQNQGYSVQCYVTHPPFAELLRSKGIQTVQLISTKLDIIGDWKGLLKAVFLLPLAVAEYTQIIWVNRHADVVVMSGFMEKCLVSWLAKLCALPVVWIEYGPLQTVLQKFGQLPYFLYAWATGIPELVIVPTRNTAHHLLASLPSLASKLHIIPCGRSLPSLEPTQVKPYQVVCVSRMEDGKGQDLLVAAFAQVVRQFPQAHLVFVGEGGFVKTVKRVVQQYGLVASVSFLDFVPHSLPVVQTSAVVVFPSVWELEGFGLVTIEAMALGKPVVAFETGPTPEIITHNKTGLLVKKGDTQAMADAIIRLLADRALQQRLGKAAQAKFNKKYTIEQVGIQYLTVLEKSI